MEHKNVKLEEAFPVIKEQLEHGGKVTFGPKGTSMLPLLVQGRDSVTIASPPPKLKKYDLPLYRRKDGKFVLHRVVAVNDDGTYVMCGDNQRDREYGITQDNILAIVTSVKRKGKEISVNSSVYKAYCRFIVFYRQMRKRISLTKYRLTHKKKR